MSTSKKGKSNKTKKTSNKATKSASNMETKDVKKESKEIKKTAQTSEKNVIKNTESTVKKNITNGSNNKKQSANKVNEKKQSTSKEDIVFKNSKSNEKNTEKVTKPAERKESSKNLENKEKVQENKKEVSKQEKNNIENKKTDNKSKEKLEVKKDNNEKKSKNKNTGKKIVLIIVILIVLVIVLAFSTCFALLHATKDTIARGITIKNIDVSNLTYNEAKSKLEETFDVALDISIDITYEDFSYVITGNELALSYELTSALNEAYDIGRTGNILENNYQLISTAVVTKNIDVQFTYDDELLNTIVQYVETNVPGLVTQYSYYIEDDQLIITPGVDGIKVDGESLRNQIIEIIQNRDLTNISEETKDVQLAVPYDEVESDDIDIDAIYSEVYSEPQDAYYIDATETTEFEIHEDVDGVDFAITIDEAKEIVSEEGLEQYIIPLTITKAAVTISDIGIEAFPYQVSTFQTTYDASNTGRSTNLKIASTKINGTVLMPGEQFSFNEVVGERTVSEGYQNAAIYSNGQVVDGLAGGICQVSSTLYNAVLLANLQVDERYNHSFTTSYVKAGRDATVVYGVKDFKFTNTRKYPIKIEATVSNGVVTFTIYGIEEENEYEVKIIPTTTSTIAYTTQTVVDSSLSPGATVVSQSGTNGCTVTTRKEVYLNGVQISNEVISNDTYQAMTRIVRVGPTVTTETTTTTDESVSTETVETSESAQTTEIVESTE